MAFLFLPSCWIWIIIDSNHPKYSTHWHISKKRFRKKRFKLYRQNLHLSGTNTVRTDGIYISSNRKKLPKHFIFDRFFESGHYIACTYECKENCPPLDSLREKYVDMFRYGYYSVRDDGRIIVEVHDNVIGMQQAVKVYDLQSGFLKLLYRLDERDFKTVIDTFVTKKQSFGHFSPIKFESGYQPNW